MLQGICDALTLAGYETRAASNGLEAIAYLQQKRIDLILSDIMMPGMDGYELFERVRRNPAWTFIPFIFLTAKGQKVDVRLGKQLGADDYLTKPFEIEDLVVAVQSRLDRVRALRKTADVDLVNLKRNILNMLSHEFRTPLTYISGYAELLQSEEFEPEELKQFLGNICKGSERLRRLVEDFLFVVVLETGEAQATFMQERSVCHDLATQLSLTLDAMEPQATAQQVGLKREFPASLPPINCHAGYVRDAVARLVDNGIKFSRRGGVVTVRAWADDAAIHIAVIDQGVGISPDQQPRLFQCFSQINREKMEQQGSGIGLYIVKSIVDLHGGQIHVVSSSGAGSTFAISLPRTP